MWIRYLLLIITGVSAGIAIAGSFVAVISLIGIFPKLAEKTKTAKCAYLYETCLIAGVTFGNWLSLYGVPLGFGKIGLFVLGLFGGIFVGCLAGALEEVLNLFPIVSRRTGLRHGMPYVIYAIAIGKSIGTFIQYFVFLK